MLIPFSIDMNMPLYEQACRHVPVNLVLKTLRVLPKREQIPLHVCCACGARARCASVPVSRCIHFCILLTACAVRVCGSSVLPGTLWYPVVEETPLHKQMPQVWQHEHVKAQEAAAGLRQLVRNKLAHGCQ